MRELGLEPTRSGSVFILSCCLPARESRTVTDAGEADGGRDTPGVLSAGSPTLCFAGKLRAHLALTVSLWCTSSQRLAGWSVQSSLEADEAKPPPLDSRPWPRPAPSWPWATPQGCRSSTALALCCGLAEVHASLPRRSGPPVYPANSQALHTAVQRPRGGRLGAPGGPGLSELPLGLRLHTRPEAVCPGINGPHPL